MCIEAVREVVEDNQQLDLGVPVECVLEALEITMSSNNGKFANNFFTQINGATIGGPESASVTDIFGAIYIDPVAKNGGPIVPTDWKRYRDDTFNIEEDVEEQELSSFTEYLNSNILESKMKFTMETSRQELVFLDTKVHLKNGYLIPEIYSKPTDSHEYLNPKSCHPPQVTRNNPYSVALRVRRNCSDRDSDDKMFIGNMVKYKAYLLESGYASDQIDGHFIKVAKLKRNDGCRKRGSSVKKKKINFVTTWGPMFPDINEALGKFQHILEEDDECRNLFPKGSFRVSYKRSHKNLKELIAPSKIALPGDCEERGNSKRQYQGKCVKCGGCGKSVKGRKRRSGIYTCQVLEESTEFKSTQTGKFQHILEEDDECRNLFPKGSFRVSYKRSHKNLKELIAPSKIALPGDCEERGNSKRQYQGKCVKCGGCGKSVKGRKRRSGIYTCQVLEESTEFKSTQTGERHKIRQDIDCKSDNIIYLVTYKKCGFQGVGSCTKLSQRVSNYITSIEKKSPGCNIEKHFLKADHSISDFSVLGIVKLENPPPDPIDRLREFEGYWMIKLNTLEPYGLNGINEYARIVRKSGLRNMFDIDNPGES